MENGSAEEIVKRINGNIHTSGCNLKVVTVIWNCGNYEPAIQQVRGIEDEKSTCDGGADGL